MPGPCHLPSADLLLHGAAVNAAVSVDAVRNLLEQRQARQPRSRRRARSIKSATSDTSARTSRTGTSTDTGNTSGSLTHRDTVAESSANGVSARAARARARQRAEGKQTANSGTSRTVRQPCADLAENIARNRGLPVDQVQSDSIASSSADAEVPASVPVDAPKHKVWVRPRSECPASASVEQPAGNKKRRQTTTLQLSKTDSAASGSTMVVGDHKLRSLKQIHGAKLIALSGFGTQPERLQSLESMIIRLGGKISRKTGFDHKCTHVIVACDGIGSLRRTEKVWSVHTPGTSCVNPGGVHAYSATTRGTCHSFEHGYRLHITQWWLLVSTVRCCTCGVVVVCCMLARRCLAPSQAAVHFSQKSSLMQVMPLGHSSTRMTSSAEKCLSHCCRGREHRVSRRCVQ